MEKNVLVAFEDQIKNVKEVKWNTTAEDIIRRYKLFRLFQQHCRSSVYRLIYNIPVATGVDCLHSEQYNYILS